MIQIFGEPSSEEEHEIFEETFEQTTEWNAFVSVVPWRIKKWFYSKEERATIEEEVSSADSEW